MQKTLGQLILVRNKTIGHKIELEIEYFLLEIKEPILEIFMNTKRMGILLFFLGVAQSSSLFLDTNLLSFLVILVGFQYSCSLFL